MKSILYSKILILASALFICTSGFAQRMKYHRISAIIEPQQLEILFKNGLEVDHFGYEQKQFFTAEVSDDDIKVLKQNNIKYTVLIEDLEQNLAKYNKAIDAKAGATARTAVATPTHFALGSYGGFYTFAEMQTILDQMRTLYPNLISAKSSIGTSLEGRPIYMVKISDNPDVNEAEPQIFMNAVHHAREPISLSQLIYFMWHLLENYNSDKEIQTLLNSTELYIVPCVNPDGYVYNQTTNPSGGGMWRKNRKNNGDGTYGIDLNRNYSYKWGYDNVGSSPTTSSDTYRGTAAFSEPETVVMKNFCNAHTFALSMDFHSYGNYCIYPYSYIATNNNPELSTFQQMGAYFTVENGFVYGNAQQTVAYTANGAGDDWKYAEQTTKGKIYSFTPEIGTSTDGFYPASSRIIPLCNSTVEMDKKALRVGTYYAKLTPSTTTTFSTASSSLAYSIQNFSVKPATYTVSIAPISAVVTSVGANKTYSTLTLLQNQADNIAFTIDPATPFGTTVQFALTINNGLSARTDTVSLLYNCATPTSLTTSNLSTTSATLTWGAVAGASNYYVSYQNVGSSTWSAETLVSGATTYSLAGLTANTAYNWRVRTDFCSNLSTTATFTTLPLCSQPISLTTTSITTTGATLNWAAVSGVTNYTVEYKTSAATTWTTAASATTATSVTLTGLTASTIYNWQVRANCPAGTSANSSSQFTTNSAVTYCASKGNTVTYEWIDYVALGTLARTSGSDAGYYNGTALSTNLARSSTYAITFSGGFSGSVYKEYWSIWIDYNKNGVFTDAGEQIVSTSNTTAGNTSVTFTVPASAALGTTRMRVAMKYGAAPTSCETFTYGEVEDYTINITTIAAKSERITTDPVADLPTTDFENIISNEPQMLDIEAFPNPVSDYLTIRFNQTDSPFRKIKMFSLKGTELLNKDVSTDRTSLTIDMRENTTGSYYIQVQEANRNKTIRVMKE